MPDHLHTLVAFPADQSMEKAIWRWKNYTARMTGIKRQHRFFDHRLRDQSLLENTVNYIRENPIRAGLNSVNEPWPWQWPHADFAAKLAE